MCNAFGYLAPVTKLAETFRELRIPLRFDTPGPPNLGERDPIRPTEPVPTVRADGEHGALFAQLKWGFAPPRPKTPPVINFRSEGRRFGTGTRALILASWFYEFTGDRYPKTRWRFTKRSVDGSNGAEDPFAIAGFIRAAGGADAKGVPWPESITMLTVEPGPDVAPIHNRQVAVIERSAWGAWLFGEADAASALLRPSAAGTFEVKTSQS